MSSDAVLAVGVEVGAPDVADEQRVAGEHEPRLVAARVIGHHVGVMRERVAGGGERLDLGVAEHDDLAVGQRVVLERRRRRPRAGRRSRRCARRARAGPETWSAWTCVSKTATIGTPWALGERRCSRRRGRRAGRRPRTAPASCSPNRYEAQAVSSLSSWRRNMRATLRAGRSMHQEQMSDDDRLRRAEWVRPTSARRRSPPR